MSKLDIGVGDEFPLDEGRPEHHRHGRRHGRHAHHHHRHGRHGHRHGPLHLPLFLAVAGIAALIGAGKIPTLATDVILALAAVAILVTVVLHRWFHRRWHADQRAS
jgi:hypothetical protein